MERELQMDVPVERRGPAELVALDVEAPEVGEQVEIETPGGVIKATWLGPVGTGPGAISLAEAMQLMNDIIAERQAERRRNGK